MKKIWSALSATMSSRTQWNASRVECSSVKDMSPKYVAIRTAVLSAPLRPTMLMSIAHYADWRTACRLSANFARNGSTKTRSTPTRTTAHCVRVLLCAELTDATTRRFKRRTQCFTSLKRTATHFGQITTGWPLQAYHFAVVFKTYSIKIEKWVISCQIEVICSQCQWVVENGIEAVCAVCPELRDHIDTLTHERGALKRRNRVLEDENARLLQQITSYGFSNSKLPYSTFLYSYYSGMYILQSIELLRIFSRINIY